MTPTDFIHEWTEFGEERAYLLMAIARRTHNDHVTNATEPTFRRVLTDADQIDQQYSELRALIDRYDGYTFRIYLTVNARDTLKAYFAFRTDMNGWIEDYINGDEHAREKFGKVSSYWKSAIHAPECRADSYFVFDLDTTDHGDYLSFVESLPTQNGEAVTNPDDSVFVRKRQTPNGYHVITDPFNHTEFDSPVEYDDLDTDGMVHIKEVRL